MAEKQTGRWVSASELRARTGISKYQLALALRRGWLTRYWPRGERTPLYCLAEAFAAVEATRQGRTPPPAAATPPSDTTPSEPGRDVLVAELSRLGEQVGELARKLEALPLGARPEIARQAPSSGDRLYTVRQLKVELGAPEGAVRQAIQSGELLALRIGRQPRVRARDFWAWANARRSHSAPESR